MAAARWLAAALLVASAFFSPAAAALLCEGCWEVGGSGALLLPGDEGGLEATWGIGAFGAFHFRPYWSVGFGLDRSPGAIENGPDETLTLLLVRGTFTFRSERDQRMRPYAFFGAGMAFDQVGADEVVISTQTGPISARSKADSDTGVAYTLGVGGHASLGERSWLRFEGQWVTWSTFGIAPEAYRVIIAWTRRIGR